MEYTPHDTYLSDVVFASQFLTGEQEREETKDIAKTILRLAALFLFLVVWDNRRIITPRNSSKLRTMITRMQFFATVTFVSLIVSGEKI